MKFAFSLLLCISLACASQAPAQVGAIRGRAVDHNGNGLPGITVTLESEAGKAVQTVTTGEDGSYAFPAAPVGRFRVISLFAGYSTPKPVEVTVSPGGMTLPPPLVLVSPE
jgi:hypothetical protein